MKRYIVVEGQTDELILRWMLEGVAEAKDTEIVRSRGRNAAPADARTLLFKTGSPVGLVVDADQRDDLATLKSYFSVVGPDAVFALLVARPSIEGVLLASEEIVAKLAGRKPKPEELVIARYDPKKAIVDLLGATQLKDALGNLGEKERELLWKQELGLRLREFFDRLREIGPLKGRKDVRVLVKKDPTDPASFELIVVKPDHRRSIRMSQDVADMLRGGELLDAWLLKLAEKEAELERPPTEDPFVAPAGEAPASRPAGASPVAPAGEPPPRM